jgi:hypothetical protein
MKTLAHITNKEPHYEIFNSDFFNPEERIQSLIKIIELDNKSEKDLRQYLWNLIKNSGKLTKIAINKLIEIGNKGDLSELCLIFKNKDAFAKLKKEFPNDPKTIDVERNMFLTPIEIYQINFYNKNKETNIPELMKLLHDEKNKKIVLKIISKRELTEKDKTNIRMSLEYYDIIPQKILFDLEFWDLLCRVASLDDLFKYFFNTTKHEEVFEKLSSTDEGIKMMIKNKNKLIKYALREPKATPKIARFLATQGQTEALIFKSYLNSEELKALVKRLNNKQSLV